MTTKMILPEAPTIITTRKGGPIDFAKVINNPTAGDVHVNRPLTNFAQKFMQRTEAFIALRAFPNMPVKKQGDLYYTFDKDDFYRDDVKLRADGTESAGSGFKLSTDPYFADVWAYHKNVSDRQRANADEAIQPDRSAVQFVTQKHLIRRERDWALTFFGPTIWDTDVTPSPLWDAASSTPIEDIRTGIRTVHENTGFRPNKMVLGRVAWDALQDNDDMLSRITGGATTAIAAKVMLSLIAGLLELEQILVMDGVVNVSVEGAATQTTQFIGGDHALIYYAPNSAGLEDVTAAANFNWTGLLGNSPNGMRIKRFRMEALASDRIEGEMAFDHKLVGSSLGYFLEQVTA